jgi:hypothetical protein
MDRTEKLKFYLDGHMHSLHSDGFTKPQDIPQLAISKGLDIVSLTDHDTVSGVPAFLEAAARLNQEELRLLAIPGIEITTREGHLLVWVPGQEEGQRFVSKFKTIEKPPFLLETIERYVEIYNAICVLAHPAEKRVINGVSLTNIRRLVEKMSEYNPQMFDNLGIEIHNWMRQAFFWNQERIEDQLQADNRFWRLAEFSGSDAHLPMHIGNGRTKVKMNDLSAESLYTAVATRETEATVNYRTLAMPEAVLASTLGAARSLVSKPHRD